MTFAQGRQQRKGAEPVDSGGSAVITLLGSNITRMAPCVVSADGIATVLAAGAPHTARYQWTVTYISGPGGWTPLTCLDPRPGLQEGETINSATECEGFNFCFFADVAGTYRLTLNVTDEDYGTYTAYTDIVIAADTRTALYVSASGNDTTGDGSIGNPWRQPSKAMDYIVANGKANFSVLIEKGGTYTGFGNDAGADADCSNIYIGPYGSGAKPILKWSTALYPSGNLLSVVGAEGWVVRGLNLRGNDSDNIHGLCVNMADECLNIGFVDLTFGGAADTDSVSYCFLSNATNTNNAIPPYQGRGYGFFNISGHSEQYFLFSDAPDIEGIVATAGFTPTTTEFECDLNGKLSSTNDVYNGMEIMLSLGLDRNKRYTVLDYVGNTGFGRCKFTLTSALQEAPTNGARLYIASIVDVGDSLMFMFGVENHATASLGTEVRTRLINSYVVTAVASVMDGSLNALQPKSGWRLMVDYCYLYRSAELNGGIQIGVDLGAGGCGPHNYLVFDRVYMGCLDDPNKGPFSFTYCSYVMVKGCVGKGSLDATQETNNLVTFSSEYNAGGVDIRIVQSSIFMNVWANGLLVAQGQGLATGRTYWPAAFLTFENNLQIHGATLHYTDFIYDPLLRQNGGTGPSCDSCVGNVFVPDESAFGGGLAFSIPDNVDLTLAQLNAETFADGNAYGTMTADALIAADYVPSGTPETTNRTTTSKGVFQDYYGNNPVGGTYCGAVSRAP